MSSKRDHIDFSLALIEGLNSPLKDLPHGAEDPRRNNIDSLMFSHESGPEKSFNDNASVASYSSDITDYTQWQSRFSHDSGLEGSFNDNASMASYLSECDLRSGQGYVFEEADIAAPWFSYKSGPEDSFNDNTSLASYSGDIAGTNNIPDSFNGNTSDIADYTQRQWQCTQSPYESAPEDSFNEHASVASYPMGQSSALEEGRIADYTQRQWQFTESPYESAEHASVASYPMGQSSALEEGRIADYTQRQWQFTQSPYESVSEDSFNEHASMASYPVGQSSTLEEGRIADQIESLLQHSISLTDLMRWSEPTRKAEDRKRELLIPKERPVVRGISDTIPDPVGGSSSENPQKKRRRESVENKPLRQGTKILADRTDRLIKNFEATSSRLKLLCMQTCPENRNLLSQVNLVASPLESDLQTIKNDIKDIFEEGKGGQVTDKKKREKFKETEHKLDNATVKHSKFNSQVEKLETLLKSDTVDYKDLKKKLQFEFPEIFTGETAMVEGQVEAATPNIPVILQTAMVGGQVEAATPNIPVILQSIATAGEIQKARGMDTGLADNTIPIEDGMKLVLDWKKEQLGPLECEATLEKAKEAGFLEEKDAETSLKNILSIYFAFKMKQK